MANTQRPSKAPNNNSRRALIPLRETIADKEFTTSARLLGLLELRARGPDEHRSVEDFIDSPWFSNRRLRVCFRLLLYDLKLLLNTRRLHLRKEPSSLLPAPCFKLQAINPEAKLPKLLWREPSPGHSP